MQESNFLERHGFSGNPFASTNSETEEFLSRYFVPPPYFESVLGSPETPKTSIVFAPRGSGKTAQRRMMEVNAESPAARYCCITYTDFVGIRPASASLADHQVALCRLMTMAILGKLEGSPDLAAALSDHQRRIIKYCARSLLNDLTRQQLDDSLDSVKSLGDRASEKWQKYGGVVAVALTAVLRKCGVDDVDVTSGVVPEHQEGEALANYLFPQLILVLRSLGYQAVYVLVDKVDEMASTGSSPEAAFSLVEPLLLDLPTLEQPGCAFKFFLWDQLQRRFEEAGGRSDRLFVSALSWTVAELSEMLARRMYAFSNGQIENFNDLLSQDSSLDAHSLLAQLNPNSPRDMIRMANRVIAEHTRQPGYANSIADFVVIKGIHEFSIMRSAELFGQYMSDIRRLSGPTFSMNRLASDVFKISAAAVRNKVVAWGDAGAVQKVGEEATGARPIHIYAIKDPRLLLAISPISEVFGVLENMMFLCSRCNGLKLGVGAASACPHCGFRDEQGTSSSLLAVCGR